MSRISVEVIRDRYECQNPDKVCPVCGEQLEGPKIPKMYDPPSAKSLVPGAKGMWWHACAPCRNLVKTTQSYSGKPILEIILLKRGNVTRYSKIKMANGLTPSHPKFKRIYNSLGLTRMDGGYLYYPSENDPFGDEVDYQSWLIYLDKRDMLVKMNSDELKEAIKVFPDKRFGTWVYDQFTNP